MHAMQNPVQWQSLGQIQMVSRVLLAVPEDGRGFVIVALGIRERERGRGGLALDRGVPSDDLGREDVVLFGLSYHTPQSVLVCRRHCNIYTIGNS